jgi:hypothetical protein
MEIHTQRLKVHRDVSIDRTRDSVTEMEIHSQRLKMQRDVSIDHRCWGREIRIQRRRYIHTAPENAKRCIDRSSLLGTRDSDTAKEIHTQRLKMQRDVSIDRRCGDKGFGYSEGDTYTAPENAKRCINRSSLLGTRDSDTAKEIHTQRLKMQRDV